MKQGMEDETNKPQKTIKNYKKLYEASLDELKNIGETRLEYKKLYKTTLKELEDYKGARLKYKRIASSYEHKYNKLTQSKTYLTYLNIKKILKVPLNLFSKLLNKKVITSNKATINSTNYRKSIFEMPKLNDISFNDSKTPTTVIYANLNINVVDGSSVWLSSVTNLFNLVGDVVILSKYDIQNDLVTSNFKSTKFKRIIVEPKDLKIDSPLNLSDISALLVYIDEILPSVQNLLVRGTEAIEEIVKNNNFKGRLIPYLTNFYIQKESGSEINKQAIATLEAISHQAKVWLWQTEEMKDKVEENVTLINNKYILFPPILETDSFPAKERGKEQENTNEGIVIGYAGKIQPDWGILELIEETQKLIQNGHKIKLRIISSKISWRGTIKSGEGFVEKVKKYLKKDFIEYIANVNRDKAIELLNGVDYIWSYRDSGFENSTLELSTKLLEAVALGKPLISYPSTIHKKVLGDDYPYFLEEASNLGQILFNNKNTFDLEKLASKTLTEFSLEKRANQVNSLVTPLKENKLLIAGHDYKFIDHYYSHLKNTGYQVFKDYWEWGEPNLIERSKSLYERSDIIFCEWGLANAVWFSKHNQQNKPLFIREHLQEINPKARKFGPNIDIERVTKVIFVSERVCKTARNLWEWDRKKTIIIPNYVLTDSFRISKDRKKPGLNLGIVGITPQRKRLDRAITLLEEILVEHPEAKLFIKGERPENYVWMHSPGRVEELDYYNKEYKRIEENKLLKNAVIFDGFDNNMPEWYQKIDFILSPSDFESFHYALADGVSSGCIPIIWNWEESKEIYSEDWIVNNKQGALSRIENTLSLSLPEYKKIIQLNKKLIVKKYGYNIIYKSLIKAIMPLS